MSVIVLNLFSDDKIAKNIATAMNAELGEITIHQFPDTETRIKINSEVRNRKVILLVSLNQPNEKILPLLFAVEDLRELGAQEVGLVTPYLAYMRQDKSFFVGEGVSAKYFAKILSSYFDWLITVDPHLHRIHDLNEIYSIPTKVLSAGVSIAQWIKKHVKNPVVIGPDSESDQWVVDIAQTLEAPFIVSEKNRIDDAKVEVLIPQLKNYLEFTPVIVDDIISTGVTMIETVKQIKQLNMIAPICVGIHAVFAGHAYEDLLQAGASKVVTCNTINHISNMIDLSELIVKSLLEG